MNLDLTDRLHKLTDAHDAEVIDEDMYQASLRKLRDQYGAAQVDALLQQGAPPAESRTHSQYIREYTSIQAAIAGDVHGDIYIVGERAESTKALLAGYLRWLVSQCGRLPLSGVREQKTATDVLNIGLDQVYTQLATTELVEREFYEGEALKHFDPKQYLAEHVGQQLLPGQQRYEVQTPLQYVDEDNLVHSLSDLKVGHETIDLQRLSAQELAEYAQICNVLKFRGPRLVTEAIAASPRLVLLGEPGSGKSTALRYLALTLARVGLDASLNLAVQLEGWHTLGDAGRLIPLFMPLLPLAQHMAAYTGRNGTAADLWPRSTRT